MVELKLDSLKDYGLISIIIGLIVAGAGFTYHEWYNIPKLTYEELDSYPIGNEGKIIPIIIRNDGHDKATNIRITIDTGGQIQNVEKITPENLQLEIDNNRIIANLDRLVEDSQITFYIKVDTLSSNPINQIFITSDQGPGKIYGTSGFSTIYLLIGISTILIALQLHFRSSNYELSKAIESIESKETIKHSAAQNLILSYLCDNYDLKAEAEEYRKANYKINYWSEADRIGKLGIDNPKLDVTEKWKNVLFDLINYAGVAEDSISIIYFNIARIEQAEGNKADSEKHLQEARKYSKELIDKRLKIDPLLKS